MKLVSTAINFITTHISSLIGAVFIFFVGSILFFNFFPFHVAEFKSITVKSDTQVGGILEYTNEYCQNVQKGTDRTLRRFLIPKDSTLVNPVELSSSPEDETQQGAGCRVSTPIRLPINTEVPPGEYKLRVKACYDIIFRIRCVPVQGESDYFQVSKLNIEDQLISINQKIDEINTQLKTSGSTILVNTLTPFPQIQQPLKNETPETIPEITPPEKACAIDLLGIRLLCKEK